MALGTWDILRFRVTAPDGWDVRGKPCSIWKVLQHSHLSLETKVIQFLPALDSRSFWIHPEWHIAITWRDHHPLGFLLYRGHTP